MVRRTAILVVLVALGACSQGRKLDKLEETASNSACTRCHGGTDNDTGAPPGSMRGATTTTDRGVGAHSAHVEAGTVAGAFPCTTCHPDPRSGSTAHGNGKVDISFSGVAAPAAGAPDPQFVPETGTCSSVYCHGAFQGGSAANAPVWTNVGSGAGACGTCHGVPPAAPHPSVSSDLTRCRVCHSESIDATGKVLGAGAGGKHLDGAIQSSGHGAAWMNPASDGFHAYAANANLLSCGECHGADLSGGQVGIGCGSCHDAGLPAGVASWNVNCVMCHGGTDNGTGAPPRTIRGQSGDAVRVGAHTKHVEGGTLASAFGCEVCHPKPTDALTPGHVNGSRADVAFSGIAVQGLAVSPSWDPASRTCATYCHGATLTGASNPAPDWTGGPSEATCGSCHGAPPPFPHPQTNDCARCHSGTVLTSGAIDLAGGKHVDGTVQVDGGGCTACHGTEGANPAPPAGTNGETLTTQRAVGAHQKHVVTGTIRSGLACSACHAPVSDLTHVNGAISLPFTGLASQGTTPAWNGATCASTYCHGATLGAGGSTPTPTWTAVSAGPTACGSCHGSPPPLPHPQNDQCNRCHKETVLASGAIDLTGGRHIDGTVQVSAGGCTGCHGTENVNAAPPLGTNGETLTTQRAVGAHQKHVVNGPIRNALACDACHAPVSELAHVNGTISMPFAGLASQGTTPSWNGMTCSSTYCHGSTIDNGGSNRTPTWTAVSAGQTSCGSCHGAPPPNNHPLSTNCGGCHGAGYSATTVNPATHVNGNLELNAMTCTSCHGDATKTATPEAPLNAAPPTDTAGLTSSPKVGAHQGHVRASDRGGAASVACTECHVVPTSVGHTDGVVPITFGPLSRTGGASPTFNAQTLTCSATYCHGNYSGSHTYWPPGGEETVTVTYSGKAAVPSWPGTAGCGSCHGAPPADGTYWHSGLHPGGSCSTCHPDAQGTAGTATITTPALHVDGKVDLNAKNRSGCSCHFVY